MPKYFIAVIGATASGKSTFIDFAKKQYPDYFTSINIGQILRAKYPPEYFEGQGTLDKTEDEVRKLVEDAVKEFVSSDKQVLLIDGQPRNQDQIEFLEVLQQRYEIDGTVFVWVSCTDGERERRGSSRSQTQGELELFNSRKIADKISIHNVLFDVLDRENTVITCDTSQMDVEREMLWTVRYALGKFGLTL